MAHSIDLSDLPPTMIDAIEAIVRAYRQRRAEVPDARPIGWARDYLPDLPASFFDELPPDILEAFEGKAA